MQQLQGTITIETIFIHNFVLNYFSCSQKIFGISFHTDARKIKNLNKNNSFICESKKQILEIKYNEIKKKLKKYMARK